MDDTQSREQEAECLLSIARGSGRATFESEVVYTDKSAHAAACRALQVGWPPPLPPPLLSLLGTATGCKLSTHLSLLPRALTSCRLGASAAGSLLWDSSCWSCTHPRSSLWVRFAAAQLAPLLSSRPLFASLCSPVKQHATSSADARTETGICSAQRCCWLAAPQPCLRSTFVLARQPPCPCSFSLVGPAGRPGLRAVRRSCGRLGGLPAPPAGRQPHVPAAE